MKELGFEQDSLFYWWGDKNGKNLKPTIRMDLLSEDIIPIGLKKGYCSAFTGSELGELLPNGVASGKNCDIAFWKCFDEGDENFMRKGGKYFECDTEADARAKMLIYLKEQNIL